MTQVNLLPSDVKIEQQVRRTAALVIAAGVAVVGLLFLVFVLQSARLMRTENALKQQQMFNERLNSQIASLSAFGELERNVAVHQALLDAVEAGEVQWSGILRDVSLVEPDQMFLNSMSGSVASFGGPAQDTGASLIGSIQFSGVALDNPTLAKWLTRLEEVTGWVNPWVSSANKDEGTGRVDFSGTVDLTPEVSVHQVLAQ